jgi:hypothetical protein
MRTKVCSENIRRNHLGVIGVDRRIILKWMMDIESDGGLL